MMDDATLAQIKAADPDASTWLSANAGSGKTRVLTDRVARLLLNGVNPQRILCLTYTKAAASEMQNRLFARLGEWAMMPDDALSQSLLSLGLPAGQIAPDMLRQARRLFAKAIETPGGLKIQTIHSFCAALLRRFPLEAGVSPAFTEMDERSATLLRAKILENIALSDPAAMAGLARHFTGEDTDTLMAEMARQQELFTQPQTRNSLCALFDLPTDISADDILARVFSYEEPQIISAILPALQQGKNTDQTLAAALAQIDLTTPGLNTLARLEVLFLSGAKTKAPFTPKAHPPTKDAVTKMGSTFDPFDALRHRVASARPQRIALEAMEKTLALHEFSAAFLPMLEKRKQQLGWLDFDDLIQKARQLLTNPGVAAWVLFRLDGGIDHILVDEAQDTSPVQWDVVRLLAQEFTAGEGARQNTKRTIFVVGDQKQSIYSFQGADPDAFEQMRKHFGDALALVGAKLKPRELLYSFRSAAPILNVVDASFTPDLRGGMGDHIKHLTFKRDLPGRVDLWDWIDPENGEHDKAWFDPVDTVGSNHHNVQLARKIADMIDDRLKHGQITEIIRENGQEQRVTRAIRPGDFLILVQRRAPLFHEIIRACKDKNLPMAGADRLRVGAELGVKDLTALLSYLATPEDDLSLACVLRSPLCGLSEAELYDLAHGRENTFLRQTLETQKDRFTLAYDMLQDMRRQADFLRPYDLLERVLTRHKGREKLRARLGQEADEGIDALLDQALAYEHADIPSLTGFLNWLASDEVTIKRQMDNASDQIRVMTVHGAKGLEAPIVILPDTGTIQNRVRTEIFDHHGTAMWKARTDDMPAVQKTLLDAQKTRQAEERLRLLYVAMTRAESWLIVCGAGTQTQNDTNWYQIVQAGMQHAGAVSGLDGITLRVTSPDWPKDAMNPASQNTQTPQLPTWTKTPPAPPVKPPALISPSDLGGSKALPGGEDTLNEEQAIIRGSAIHKLLEHLPKLPPEQRAPLAQNLLYPFDLPDKPAIIAETLAVLGAPHLAFLFTPDTLEEVAITARLNDLGGQQISGAIDRLVVGVDRILAVDFKSNATLPIRPEDAPEGLLRQMGAYAAALEQIYPGKKIDTAIVWTKTAQLMPLPHDIVRMALLRAHTS